MELYPYASEIREKNNFIIDFLPISSKTGYNVKNAFYNLVEKIS